MEYQWGGIAFPQSAMELEVIKGGIEALKRTMEMEGFRRQAEWQSHLANSEAKFEELKSYLARQLDELH
jgi:hypothetical protein